MSTSFEEREYQNKALSEIRRLWKLGIRKILLWLATGAGKTHIFSTILIKTKLTCLMVVRGRELVQNAHLRLWNEGVPHGVKMAGHWNVRPSERIQIASVDTLMRKDKHTGEIKNPLPKFDIVIIDEVHFATSQMFRDLIKYYEEAGAFFLGVTATPYTPIGLGHIVDAVVHPITMDELMDEGYLVTPIYYGTRAPELKGVRKNGDEFNIRDLEKSEDTSEIIGDIVIHWKDLAQARPTLGFAVTIKHSKDIVQEFLNEGIEARHLDAESTDKEREQGLKDLQEGRLKIIFNVGIFSTGKDIPWLGCIIDAAPTKSLIRHQQKLGRGTRRFDGDNFNSAKNDFIVIDHAGNVPRHGRITDEYEPNLDKDLKKKKKFENTKPVKTCKKCRFIYESGDTCPSCGSTTEPREFEVKDGMLKEIVPVDPKIKALRELRLEAKRKGKGKGWIYHRLIEKFGAKIAAELVPPISAKQRAFFETQKTISATNQILKQKK